MTIVYLAEVNLGFSGDDAAQDERSFDTPLQHVDIADNQYITWQFSPVVERRFTIWFFMIQVAVARGMSGCCDVYHLGVKLFARRAMAQ